MYKGILVAAGYGNVKPLDKRITSEESMVTNRVNIPVIRRAARVPATAETRNSQSFRSATNWIKSLVVGRLSAMLKANAPAQSAF